MSCVKSCCSVCVFFSVFVCFVCFVCFVDYTCWCLCIFVSFTSLLIRVGVSVFTGLCFVLIGVGMRAFFFCVVCCVLRLFVWGCLFLRGVCLLYVMV